MNVLAIGAHPDDVELYCAGTLAKYAAAGHTVAIAVICNGETARGDYSVEEAVRIREQESAAAARLIGAQSYHLGYPDHQTPNDQSCNLRLLEIVRRVQPNLILTHAPFDSYIDHQRTSQLVEDCIHLVRDQNIQTETPPAPHQPFVYHMDTVFGRGFQPTDFVDITDVFDSKRRMLACHHSQIAPWRGHPVLDTMEMMEITARFRGIQCSARYAEAFQIEPKWDRTFHRRLLP